MGDTIAQLKDHYPEASILICNFGDKESSQTASSLSDYDVNIMEYPQQYKGCPLLPMEVIHHFLKTSESWLSLGQQHVLLMHCEQGGWPILAYMLAALMTYKNNYSGDGKTLDFVYKQAARELLQFFARLNPFPSQLRYLQYLSRNVGVKWPLHDKAVTLKCVVFQFIPDFDGKGGCRPIFRIYGQDPLHPGDKTPKLLMQAERELINFDINCHVQGDIVLECICLHDDLTSEKMMFRTMLNTAFMRSNFVVLNRDEIDTLWDAKDLFHNDFGAKLIFSDLDSTAFKQSNKLKALHWLKLTRAVSGSLWAEAQKSGEASKAPEIDMSELESLFPASNASAEQANAKLKSRAAIANKPEKVQLIDHRRAYNCEIMLSKVKLPLNELMDYVLALEDSGLDPDQVDNLIKFCPTQEEMETIKGYKGEKDKLGKCEQFFLELMKVPRTESKLRVFSFKMQFNAQVSDLTKNLNIVNSVVEQASYLSPTRSSGKLRRVMQTILSLGNALNQGTARGSAVGFRLDSLLKLSEIRGKNNRMTLMHYLCKVLADKIPEVLDFSKDLSSLEPAAKIQLKYLAEEMQAISKGLEKVSEELSMAENDGPVSEKFRKALKEFLHSAEGEVRSLASLYSAVGKNVDSLILYFGEDPVRCPYEQVVSTLLKFVRMFNQANEENAKQLEVERKKAGREASNEKLNLTHIKSQHIPQTPVKSA
ncbi:formin-like protein 13 isoform X1 [Tanacetum coccineum]